MRLRARAALVQDHPERLLARVTGMTVVNLVDVSSSSTCRGHPSDKYINYFQKI